MNKIVLDLETKKGFEEVAGRNLALLGVSVVGVYSYKDNQFKTFLEKDIKKVELCLAQAGLIIGFNIRGFDFPVLQPYLELDLKKLNILDIFDEIHQSLGFRLSLNSVAQATLGVGKTGTGLDALKYFRQGQIDKLAQYCQNDVFITRELYEYGRRLGHLVYQHGLSLETIPVSWAEAKSVDTIVQEAFTQRLTLEIEYSSGHPSGCAKFTPLKEQPQANPGLKTRERRRVDIYDFALGKIIAFCHLRRQLRTFNIRRILSAELTPNKYVIPANLNLQEFKAKSRLA